MEERKPIRTVVLGDLSKYHFLKEILPPSSWEEIWHKKKNAALPDMTIEVEKKIKSGDASIYFGEKRIRLKGALPPGTSLFYPPENRKDEEELLFSDRIVVFDEFPFRERALLEKIAKISSAYPLHPLSVVLYHPLRKHLDTDLTTVESAALDAKNRYESEQIRAEIHVPGNPPDFLYWKQAPVFEKRKLEFIGYPEAVRRQIEKHFPFEMELLLLELNFLVDVNEMERFIRFKADLTGKNILKEYGDRFIKAHLSHPGSEFMSGILSVYGYFMNPICIWQGEEDANELMSVFRRYWENYAEVMKEVYFHGTEKEEYHQFLLETKAGIRFKMSLSHFINKEIPVLMKKYMESNIKLYEEIIYE